MQTQNDPLDQFNPQVRAFPAPWNAGVEILIRDGLNIGATVLFETHDQGAVIGPTLTIKNKEAQLLMDDLWQAGLRPTEGTGSAGSLKATQEHLEDMKRIALHLLKIKRT